MAMRASIAENEETQAEIKEATTRLEEMVAKDNRVLVDRMIRSLNTFVTAFVQR